MIHKKEKFDCIKADFLYDSYVNSVIHFNNKELPKNVLSDQFKLNELLEYYELNKSYKKCFIINKIIKKFINNKSFYDALSLHNQSKHTEQEWQYKCVLLSIIYYSNFEYKSRFKYFKNEEEIEELMLYFENREEYDKCLILHELKSHYKLESMKRILSVVF
jgi:hypothetical protein